MVCGPWYRIVKTDGLPYTAANRYKSGSRALKICIIARSAAPCYPIKGSMPIWLRYPAGWGSLFTLQLKALSLPWKIDAGPFSPLPTAIQAHPPLSPAHSFAAANAVKQYFLPDSVRVRCNKKAVANREWIPFPPLWFGWGGTQKTLANAAYAR